MQSNCQNFFFSLLISSPHRHICCLFYGLTRQDCRWLFSILFCSLTQIIVFRRFHRILKIKNRHFFKFWISLFMARKRYSLGCLENLDPWLRCHLKFLLLKAFLDKLWEDQWWIIARLKMIYLQDEFYPF